MKSAVLILALVAAALATTPASPSYTPQGNVPQVTQNVANQFHQAQQLGYTGPQLAKILVKQGYPTTVVQYLVQQYEAGLNQPYFQSPEQVYQYFNQQQQGVQQQVPQGVQQQVPQGVQQQVQAPQGVQQQVPQGVQQQGPQGVQQQGQGVSYSNAQYYYVQLQNVLQHAQTALQYIVNGQVTNQYALQQLQQVVQYIQQIQPVSNVAPQSITQSQVTVVYQILNNLHQFVLQQGQQLPQMFVQQIELAYLTSQNAYQIVNQPQSQNVSSLYYQQLLQQIQNIQQYIQAQPGSPQLSYIGWQLNQAYQIYTNASVLSQKAYYIQPLQVIVGAQLQNAYQYLNTAYLIAQQQGLAIVGQLQNALAVAQNLQSNGPQYQVGVNQSQVGVTQVYQSAAQLVQYVQQQVAQGVMSQQQASYIVQQLQKIHYGVSQAQVQQYLQNVYNYVQQQVGISPVVAQYISQQIQSMQSLIGQVQGPNYVQSLVQKYFNQPQAQWTTPYQYNPVQQGQWNTPSQYNPVQQGQWNTPSQYNTVQQGQWNTPSQYNPVQQGQSNTPSQYNPVQQGQWNTPSQYNPVQQGPLNTPYQNQPWYTPYQSGQYSQSYQSQGMLPLAYQIQGMQVPVAAY